MKKVQINGIVLYYDVKTMSKDKLLSIAKLWFYNLRKLKGNFFDIHYKIFI